MYFHSLRVLNLNPLNINSKFHLRLITVSLAKLNYLMNYKIKKNYELQTKIKMILWVHFVQYPM